MSNASCAADLKAAYNEVKLDPLMSGDPRYVDCSSARGGEDVVKLLCTRIENSPRPMAQLISGHRGCGKSTELLRLVDDLKRKNYMVVYFAADEDIDVGDLVYTDLLMAIIKRLERAFADEDIQIDPRLSNAVAMWFAEVVYGWKDEREFSATLQTEFELGVSAPIPLPILSKILARITGQIKTGQNIRREVRLKLDPQVYQFIERVNELIQAAIPKIREKGYRDLVLVIDNLDRIVFRVLDDKTGRTTHDALFLEHAEQLKSLDLHMIYTVPISMFYSLKATGLTGAFPDYSILPMIKVKEEDGNPCSEGIDRLYEVAKRRLDIEKIYADGVVEFLADKSGGMLRDFIRLLGYTIELAQVRGGGVPITMDLAEKAFRRLVNEYGRMVPDEYYKLLAQVARNKRAPNDEKHQAMLYNLSILEYMNGNRWCDVHPAIRELPEFKDIFRRE